MQKEYSIAQARDRLSDLVHQAERGAQVRITRRGRVVARLVAEQEYQRLAVRKESIDWGDRLVDLRRFEFDRDEANAR